MIPTADRFFAAPLPSLAEEAAFFTALKSGNATFKRTAPGRFQAIDAAVLRHVQRPLREVLDVGISSGVTTLDLAAALAAAGQAPRITGTDRALDAWIVPLAPGCRALVDGQGHPLQYDLWGQAVRPWQRRLDWLTGMVAARPLLARLTADRIARRLAAGQGRRVRLVSPRLAAGGIAVVEDDVTRRNPGFAGRFDLIRAANILNLGYFEGAVLQRALGHLTDYLAGPGALLLLIRTGNGGAQNGTLFRLGGDGGLHVIDRHGNGSEVESLALAVGTRQAA